VELKHSAPSFTCVYIANIQVNRFSTWPTAIRLTPPSRSRSTSSGIKPAIPLTQVKYYGVTTLSVASDGQLLIGERLGEQLHLYSRIGDYVKSLAVPFDAHVIDAMWSPREHRIVCTTNAIDNSNMVVMSVTGKVISHMEMNSPKYLSVSADDVIYVTNYGGLSYSSDNGTTWNRLVSLRDNEWRFFQALKVTPNGLVSSYTAWIVEYNDYDDWRLSIYIPGNGTWKDVILPNSKVKVYQSRMVFDGRKNIYMTDWYNRAVHVWSVNGRYVRQLLSSQNLTSMPRNVALNEQRTLLYVSVNTTTPRVFTV
jgi:hypothetical protein